jgi:hypothetical protein
MPSKKRAAKPDSNPGELLRLYQHVVPGRKRLGRDLSIASPRLSKDTMGAAGFAHRVDVCASGSHHGYYLGDLTDLALADSSHDLP